MSLRRSVSSASSGRGKRQKVKLVVFDPSSAPAEDHSDSDMAGGKKGPEKGPAKELLYRRGEYLALRNEDDGFYLCQAQQHIYSTLTRFKITWLSELAHQPDTYISDYVDYSEPDCIITHVRLNKIAKDTYKLPANQKEKIKKSLREVLEPEDSEEEESEEDEEEEEEDEEEQGEKSDDSSEEEDSDEEPKAKRARKAPAAKGKRGASKSRPKPRVKATASAKLGRAGGKRVVSSKARKAPAKKAPAKKAAAKKPKKEEKPGKPKKRKLTPEERANPNLLLEANAKVKVWDRDPLTYSNEKVPYISPSAHSKLVFRAVAMNDMKLLQSLIDNVKTVDKVDYSYSVVDKDTPIDWAVKSENPKAIQLLVKEVFNRDQKKTKRCDPERNLLRTTGTGRYNQRSLGIPAVAKLSMSRGSKEGNNALTKDENSSRRSQSINSYMIEAIKLGVSKKTIDTLAMHSKTQNNHWADSSIYHAIRGGHRQLAATLLEDREKRGFSTFNALAKEVIQFDKEDLRKSSLREASIKKKSFDNANITPLHCAAINPNTKYMIKLFNVLPEYGICDRNNRRPIHYAAACEGTGPLEYLINRGVDPDEPDSSGFTPLMIACETGRVHNVELLLKKAKAKSEEPEEKDDDEDDEDGDDEDEAPARNAGVSKYGIGGINRPVQRPNQWQTYCPIHIAIENDQTDAVKTLIKHGVDVHKKLSAGKNKLTPLMMAASRGNMAIVKMLIKEKARVEEKDKLARTPLIHAVMNGQAHVASYLLALGANPDQADSSGNSAVHYAAAYGWYFCLKTLIDAGADPVKSNDWKVAPLGIAFLKGHLGIVDYLLQQPGIDIDFKDDQGKTLVAMACSSSLVKGIADEVTYLVNKKGADATIRDVNGNSPLHHLANNEVRDYHGKLNKEAADQSIQIAKILLSHGGSGADKNAEGITPVMYAIERGHTELVRLLIDKGGEFTLTANEEGENALHLMAQKCMMSDLAQLIDVLHRANQKAASKPGANILHQMAAAYDKNGYTPLHCACVAYKDWTGQKNKDEDRDSADSEDGDNDDEDEDEDDENSASDEDSDYDSNGGGSRGRKRKTARGGARSPQKKKAKKDEEPKEDIDPTWEYGRKFISALLDQCNADPRATVREKTYAKTDTKPTKEADRYENKDLAKYSPLHLVLESTNELPIKNKKGEIENYCPVANILLKRLKNPDLDARDLTGSTPLIKCLKRATPRTQDFAKKLIKHGADSNLRSKVKDDYSATPLCIAIKHNCKLDMIEALLAKASVRFTDTRDQNTPLHIAVAKDRKSSDVLQLVERLLKANANVNAVNKKGRTPLHLAVNANSGDSDATSELESLLVDHKADVFAKDHRGRLPLHYAFTTIGKYNETSRIDPIELCGTLTGYMLPQNIDIADKRGQTPLHLAARRGAGVCCTLLVQKRSNINLKDKVGNTPLTLAAIHGHESCVIMLLQKNANINTMAVIPKSLSAENSNAKKPDSDDEDDYEEDEEESNEDMEEEGEDEKEEDSEDESDKTKPNPWTWKLLRKKPYEAKRYPVFQVCVKNDWPGVIYMMLENVDDANFTVTKAIEAALNTERYNLVLTLLRRFKDDRKLRETSQTTGRNLLHTLAVKAKAGSQDDLMLRVAKELVRRGVPLNNKDHYGCKPIHYAALMQHTPLMKFIIENVPDMDVNESDRFGRTPLAAAFWCLKEGSLAVYEELYNQGASLNDQYSFPDVLMTFGAVPSDNRPDWEVEADYVTEQKSVRCTPLIRAIQMQNFDLVKRLLKDGADPNARDSLQRVPMVHAIRRNNLHMVKLLLNHTYSLPTEELVEYIAYTPTEEEEEEPKRGRKGGKARKPVKQSRGKNQARLTFSLGRKVIVSEEEEDEEEDEGDETKKQPAAAKKEITDIDLSKYKAFRKVSGVKLMAKDQQGWSLIHHVIAPIEEATYDNVEMLKLLSDAGAPLGEKDMTGLTPLDYALRQNAPDLAKALQKLLGVSKSHWEKPTQRSVPALTEGMTWTSPVPDFDKDSEALLKQFEDEAMEEDSDNKPVPDSKLDMEENGEVEMDEDQNMAYDVVLTKVDVQGSMYWGLYNFYIMQVVKHKAKDMWILFNRWGRIGDEGQFQRTPFNKREDAVKEFSKIFKAKTGNNWENVKTFEPQPKKYRLVDAEDRQSRKNLKDIKLNLKSDEHCHLPDHLRKLMEEIGNTSMMRKAYDSENLVDANMIPFSRIRKEAIMKAVEVLNKLSPIVTKLEAAQSEGEEIEVYKQRLDEAVKLSNEVYQLVPLSGYAFEAISVITTTHELEELSTRLINLAEMELASRVTAGAMYRRKEVHPAEYIYRSIGATLRLMNPDEIETQYLLKYINTGIEEDSYNPIDQKIEAIYEVSRPGEKHRINRCHLENHKLLFHGTRTSNLISILNRGLLIAPPGAIITGHLMGKGIYFSDMFAKSAGYCSFSYYETKHKFMLICEVALGNSQVVDQHGDSELLSYNSRIWPGSQAPHSSCDVKLRDGCTLPLGEKTERKVPEGHDLWWLPDYSEYIIFNADQVRMRYLVKFK